MHFGTGLVKTAEDFGAQGEWPTHPELLDWLATEFVRTGWDVKRMHRLIVTSATYRQSSRVTTELLDRDPENRLLAAVPRLRLSAEMIRDQALVASGLLVEQHGGPSVKPYQPAGLWKELAGAGDYVPDTGEKLYRRSLYTFWKRTVAAAGDGDVRRRRPRDVLGPRDAHNTPLQALTLLNDVTYRRGGPRAGRAGDAGGGRRRRSGSTLAFRRVTGRPPTGAGAEASCVGAWTATWPSTARTRPRRRSCCGVGDVEARREARRGRARGLHGRVPADPEPRRGDDEGVRPTRRTRLAELRSPSAHAACTFLGRTGAGAPRSPRCCGAKPHGGDEPAA